MLKKILGAILATSMLFSTNVLAEEFSTQPMISSGSTWNLALKSDGMGLGIKRIRFNGDWYSKLLFQTNANKTIKKYSSSRF